jgi:hypothetical protein
MQVYVATNYKYVLLIGVMAHQAYEPLEEDDYTVQPTEIHGSSHPCLMFICSI